MSRGTYVRQTTSFGTCHIEHRYHEQCWESRIGPIDPEINSGKSITRTMGILDGLTCEFCKDPLGQIPVNPQTGQRNLGSWR